MTADHGITGERRTLSYRPETIWRLRSTAYIAVQPGDERQGQGHSGPASVGHPCRSSHGTQR